MSNDPNSSNNVYTPNPLDLIAHEVQTWDIEGKSIIKKAWYKDEGDAREAAMNVDRTRGPGTARILKLTWVGVITSTVSPLKIEEISVLDADDPEIKEFLRLQEKFRGQRMPVDDKIVKVE